MTIVIKQGDSIEAIVKDLQVKNEDKKKALKEKAFGKIKWDEDALAFQKRLRNEWP